MRNRLRIERLEDKVTPTSTLYVDFGDRFVPDASNRNVLTDTLGNLKTTTTGLNPSINGPQLTDDTGANYADGTSFDFVSFASSGLVPVGNQAAFRSQVMAFLRRAYEPLNVTVVELTAAPQTINGMNVQGATSLADISTTLGLNEGASGGDNDAYVLVVLPEIGAGNDNPNNFAGGFAYAGRSPTTDVGIGNNTDDTAVVFLNNTPNAASVAYQIAHHAGHTFGLAHAFGNDPVSAAGINNALVQSDVMSSLSDANFGGFNFFTHFPTVRGDGNLNNDVLNALPTPYDQLANDPNVGRANNLHFVTGTGANDIITLSVGGPNIINVNVQAFNDAAYSSVITVPGSGGFSTSITYSLMLSAGETILIDAGTGADRIVILGDLNRTIQIRGMQGTDEIIIDGLSTDNASYTPAATTSNGLDGNSDWRGTILMGGTLINFQEFESTSRILFQHIATVTINSPAGVDDFGITSTAGRVTVNGTVNNGSSFVPMQLATVTTLNVHANGGDDTFRLQNAFLPPVGFSLNLQGGSGYDTIQFLSVNPSLVRMQPPGTIDGFNIQIGTATGTMTDINRVDAAGGATLDIFFGRGANSLWLIQAGDDRYQDVATGRTLDFNGFDNIAGGGQNDEFRILAGGSVSGNIDGYLGNDTIDLSAVAPQSLSIAALGADNGYNLSGSTVNAQLWNFERVLAAAGSSLSGRDVTTLWTVQNGEDRYLETASGRTLDFSGFANLTGGSAGDYFDFLDGGYLTGFIDGRGGSDTISYAALGSQQTALTGLGNIDGFNATSSLLAGGWRNINEIIGSLAGSTDRLTGLNAAAYWRFHIPNSLYNAANRTLALKNLEEALGGSLNDRFTINLDNGNPFSTSPMINGQGGNDLLTVIGSAASDSFMVYATQVFVNGLAINYQSIERIDLCGRNGHDIFTVSPVLPAGLRMVRLFGEGGNDTMNVSTSWTTAFFVDGGSGTDRLRINRLGAIYRLVPPRPGITSGKYQFQQHKYIQFLNIEGRTADGTLQQLPLTI